MPWPWTDYVAIARGAGIAKVAWAADEEDFDRLIDTALAEGGPTFIAARIDETAANPRLLPARVRGEEGGNVRRAHAPPSSRKALAKP